MRIILSLLLIILCAGLPTAPEIWAAEGPGSHYVPGATGDFAMALLGPSGWYVRNDLMYFDGTIGAVSLGNQVYASAEQNVWVNTIKGIFLETFQGDQGGITLHRDNFHWNCQAYNFYSVKISIFQFKVIG